MFNPFRNFFKRPATGPIDMTFTEEDFTDFDDEGNGEKIKVEVKEGVNNTIITVTPRFQKVKHFFFNTTIGNISNMFRRGSNFFIESTYGTLVIAVDRTRHAFDRTTSGIIPKFAKTKILFMDNYGKIINPIYERTIDFFNSARRKTAEAGDYFYNKSSQIFRAASFSRISDALKRTSGYARDRTLNFTSSSFSKIKYFVTNTTIGSVQSAYVRTKEFVGRGFRSIAPAMKNTSSSLYQGTLGATSAVLTNSKYYFVESPTNAAQKAYYRAKEFIANRHFPSPTKGVRMVQQLVGRIVNATVVTPAYELRRIIETTKEHTMNAYTRTRGFITDIKDNRVKPALHRTKERVFNATATTSSYASVALSAPKELAAGAINRTRYIFRRINNEVLIPTRVRVKDALLRIKVPSVVPAIRRTAEAVVSVAVAPPLYIYGVLRELLFGKKIPETIIYTEASKEVPE